MAVNAGAYEPQEEHPGRPELAGWMDFDFGAWSCSWTCRAGHTLPADPPGKAPSSLCARIRRIFFGR